MGRATAPALLTAANRDSMLLALAQHSAHEQQGTMNKTEASALMPPPLASIEPTTNAWIVVAAGERNPIIIAAR